MAFSTGCCHSLSEWALTVNEARASVAITVTYWSSLSTNPAAVNILHRVNGLDSCGKLGALVFDMHGLIK